MYDKKFHTQDISKLSFAVTGGAGFIGSNIVEYLLKNNAKKVVVLDSLITGFEENINEFRSNDKFSFIKGDICNIEDCLKAFVGVDYVLHQAALGSVPRSIANPIASHMANTTGFMNVLLAARDSKVKRVVYASSSSVYGDSPILPKIEDQIGKQLSPYAVTKRVDELYGEVFAKTYNMEIIGLRYFNIFGPKQNPKGEYAAAIPLFIKSLLNNDAPLINGDGEQTRDFTFVENAVQANIRAALTQGINTHGDVFNIAVSERISLNKLIELLQKIIGSNVKPIYREARAGDVRDSLADISKAKRILGYDSLVKMEEGLKITVEAFKRHFINT